VRVRTKIEKYIISNHYVSLLDLTPEHYFISIRLLKVRQNNPFARFYNTECALFRSAPKNFQREVLIK